MVLYKARNNKEGGHSFRRGVAGSIGKVLGRASAMEDSAWIKRIVEHIKQVILLEEGNHYKEGGAFEKATKAESSLK